VSRDKEALSFIKDAASALSCVRSRALGQRVLRVLRVRDISRSHLPFSLGALQSDLNQALSEKDAAEQEVLTGRLAAERNERQARQEQSRSQTETNSYKQRLERADADLIHCRRENLRLSEQIASLEKEVDISNIVRVRSLLNDARVSRATIDRLPS